MAIFCHHLRNWELHRTKIPHVTRLHVVLWIHSCEHHISGHRRCNFWFFCFSCDHFFFGIVQHAGAKILNKPRKTYVTITKIRSFRGKLKLKKFVKERSSLGQRKNIKLLLPSKASLKILFLNFNNAPKTEEGHISKFYEKSYMVNRRYIFSKRTDTHVFYSHLHLQENKHVFLIHENWFYFENELRLN